MHLKHIMPASKMEFLGNIRFYLSLVSIIFSGPIVISMPQSVVFLREFALRFGIFLVVLVLWEILLWLISGFILRSFQKRSMPIKIMLFAVVFIFSSATMFSLSHLEDKTTHDFLAPLLVLLGVRAVCQGFQVAGLKNWAFITLIIYFLGLSMLSAALTADYWHWQFLVIGTALLGGINAGFCLQQIELAIKDGLDRNLITWSKLHVVALLSAPLAIAFLQYFGFLPKGYLLCLFSLALIMRAAEIARKIEKTAIDRETPSSYRKLKLYSCYSTLAFLFLFIAAPYSGF